MVLSADDGVFIVRLTTGTLVLVHPITVGDRTFLPCTYGYATTIRRAQGSSLAAGALFSHHCYPPERGYAYVGVSRFRSQGGVYHYGPIRRSDWPLVGPGADGEQTRRGPDSEDECDQDADAEANYSGSENSESEQDRVSDAGYGSDDSWGEVGVEGDALKGLDLPVDLSGRGVEDFAGLAAA